MRIAALFVALTLMGCTTIQQVSPLKAAKPGTVCVVEHKAVMSGIRDTISASLSDIGIQSRLVTGNYQKSHGLWVGNTIPSEVSGCDALIFYVANWSWDLAYYMYFANIWMTDGTGQRVIGRATYDASRNAGFGKFINAEKKIRELMADMLANAG